MRNNKILITGGTGTLGNALVAAFTRLDYDITIVSRDPHKQELFHQRYPHVKCVLTDICNYKMIYRAAEGCDTVIHAAALKRVDTGERSVNEYIRVNVEGADVVAHACQDSGVDTALFISSDKCVNSLNLYGATKALGEKVWCSYNTKYSHYAALRYGNVMGSNGSVLTIWRDAIKNNQSIVVRTPAPTRFFLKIEDAINLVMKSLACTDELGGGYTVAPTGLQAFSIEELAKYIAGPDYPIEYSELGSGEKQHEILVAPGETIISRNDICLIGAERGVRVNETPDYMCSDKAPRMTPEEVIAKLGGAI